MSIGEHPRLPFATSRVLVISDFNCPYCFTLNEWIDQLGVSERIRWVGIEHRPSLPSESSNSLDDARQLDQEVEDVKRRFPDLTIRRPTKWINSHLALLVQNAIEDDAPALAPALRKKIFRAYWRETRSIAAKEVLDELLGELDLEYPPLEPDHLAELTKWWASDLDRIPCMLSPSGAFHFGLQDADAVRSFLQAALRSEASGLGCFRGDDSEPS